MHPVCAADPQLHNKSAALLALLNLHRCFDFDICTDMLSYCRRRFCGYSQINTVVLECFVAMALDNCILAFRKLGIYILSLSVVFFLLVGRKELLSAFL